MAHISRRKFLKQAGLMFSAALAGSAISTISTARKMEKAVDYACVKAVGTATNAYDSVTVTGLGIQDCKTGELHCLHVFPRELTPEEIKKLPEMTLREIADLK